MVKLIGSLADRITRLAAPSVIADAAPTCRDEYSHCATGCTWSRNRLAYDRICNGVFQYTWYADCGTCAD